MNLLDRQAGMDHTIERHRQAHTNDIRQLMNARTGKESQESDATEEERRSGHIATHRNVAFPAGVRFPFLSRRFCLVVSDLQPCPSALKSPSIVSRNPVNSCSNNETE